MFNIYEHISQKCTILLKYCAFLLKNIKIILKCVKIILFKKVVDLDVDLYSHSIL